MPMLREFYFPIILILGTILILKLKGLILLIFKLGKSMIKKCISFSLIVQSRSRNSIKNLQNMSSSHKVSSQSQSKSKKTACWLVCLQNSHEDISLLDGVATQIGRTIETKITDPRCSRRQVELTADCSRRKVKVKQLGNNASSVNGKDIGKDQETTMGTDSTLFVLSGQFPHKISFKSDNRDNSTKEKSSESKAIVHNEDDRNRDQGKDDSDGEKKNSMKRTNPDTTNEPDKKKKKVSNQQNHSLNKSKTKDTDTNDAKNDDEHSKNVQEKLELMKKSKHDQGKSQNALSSKDVKEKERKSSTEKIKEHQSKSSSATTESKWTAHDQLEVFTSKGVIHQRKIAGFDIDGTIIVTKSGRTFPTNADDWQIIFPDVPGKLKGLVKDGFKIVFFTNQLGVAKGKTKLDDLKRKFENVIKKLQVPVQVFIATHEGKNRKPNDGMWRKLKQRYNGGIEIDTSSSIYIGDAAGRPKDWAPKKKKDFSSSDRLYAINLGLKFYTPEEYFLGQKPAPFNMPAFDPRQVKSDAEVISKGHTLVSKNKEVIVLVGFPACGKSHFASHVLKPQGYEVVNRDTLGSWKKCVKKAEEILSHGSVVVDNTNVSKEERNRYVECAKAAKVPCRCFVFTTTIDHCRHNERFRQIMDSSHAKINSMVFNMIKSKWQEPSMDEGFSEIVKVNFVPTFSSASMEAEYRKFLSEN